MVVTLGLAFLLFWGGLQATLGRGIGAAMAGNIIAIVLVVIAAVHRPATCCCWHRAGAGRGHPRDFCPAGAESAGRVNEGQPRAAVPS